jgi:hypothetical protein
MKQEGTTARDYTHNKVAQAVTRDGVVVSEKTHGVLQSSVHDVADAATREANAPYSYALDPRTKTRQTPNQITEDSIVSINGTELTVRDARAIGWMPATANPMNDPPSQEEVTTEDRNEEEHPDLKMEPFADASADETLTEIINGTAGMEQLAAVTEIVASGEVSERTLNALATQFGVEPAQLQERFAPVMAQFEQQGRAAVEKAIPGVDSETVFAWAREHAPKALQSAMSLHATRRQTGAYEGLAQVYLEQLADTDPETALASNLGPGWSSRQDDNGRVIVTAPQGQTMLWSAAMKLRRRV